MASYTQSHLELSRPLIVTDPAREEPPNSILISPPLTPTKTHFIQPVELCNEVTAISQKKQHDPTDDLLDMYIEEFDSSSQTLGTPRHLSSKAGNSRKNNVRSFHRMRASLFIKSPTMGNGSTAREHSHAVTGIHRHRVKNTPTRSPSAASLSEQDPLKGIPTFQLDVYDKYLRDPACCLSTPAQNAFSLIADHLESKRQYNDNCLESREAQSPNSATTADDIMDITSPSSQTSKRAFDKHNVKGIYDSITSDDEEQWIPITDVLDVRTPRVIWKGSPLSIRDMPNFTSLRPKEARIASVMRLTPMQYIKCKHTLILAAQHHAQQGQPFKKSDAQKLCRVDVNKTSKLWEIFGDLGWLGSQLA